MNLFGVPFNTASKPTIWEVDYSLTQKRGCQTVNAGEQSKCLVNRYSIPTSTAALPSPLTVSLMDSA